MHLQIDRPSLFERRALLLASVFALLAASGCDGESAPSGADGTARDVGSASEMDASDASSEAVSDAKTDRDAARRRVDADGAGAAPSDAGRIDAEGDGAFERDGVDGRDDAAGTDATGDAEADGGGSDVGGPRPGFGTITGRCRVLDTELTDDRSHFFENRIDFGSNPYDASDRSALTTGGREILDDGNAGGSSLKSEVFAYEVLARCEGAGLLKTETEIAYERPNGPKTDLLIKIDGHKLGVSVTRAFAYPPEEPYERSQAKRLLTETLNDLEKSSANVRPSNAWRKQILHVVAYSAQHAGEIEGVYRNLNPEARGDAVVIVTTTDGMDGFLY